MLETRNLRKVYKTKKGVSVEALKGISLKFPEKGMIFLLGKSGSGKSTLLNLLGGLDKYDDGEIIIKGVSSKDFKQSHFDSYRNTYVGFIFQEYNVLEEFSVGANIALAIELQGRKASDDEISKILREVDLDGFGDRKPNELSGGQKQRVAIARALVKNPQIIMADEPTGALDSNTGKQVFDTLKKLSREKLVIVVSHDREFAEIYGDRIIELADGNVISDMERAQEDEIDFDQGITFEEDGFIISEGYHLTEEDRIAINEYIDNASKEVKGKIKAVKQTGGSFKETNQEMIDYVDGDFKLIKSKLPFKNSFKIGASGLKYKKFRLVITIILSFVAFAMFALADTFGNYNHIKTCTNSISDSKIQYASVSKAKKIEDDDGFTWWDEWSYKLTDEDIQKIDKDTGQKFKGVYVPNEEGIYLSNINEGVSLSDNDTYYAYATSFRGYADITQEDLDGLGYKILAGKLPDGSKKEIAISEYIYKTYEKTGYLDGTTVKEIKDYSDMIGKTLELEGEKYTVTAVIDTKVDFNRYKGIGDSFKGKSNAQTLAMFALNRELDGIKSYSLSCVAMTGTGHVENMIHGDGKYISMDGFHMDLSNNAYSFYAEAITNLSNVDKSDITWVDGEKTELADNEIIVPEDEIYYNDEPADSKKLLEYLKNDPSFNFYYSLNYEEEKSESNWKIVGVIKSGNGKSVYVLPDKVYNQGWDELSGSYSFAVSSMPSDKSGIEKLVKYCYTEKDDVKYMMQNSVTFELDTVDEVLKVLSKVFLYVGLGFALFAAIMLSNFIATSISYKRQEIGILRAIGARSNDVFRIFFSESFIIAMINFVLAAISTGVVTAIINKVIRDEAGILITILNFGPRQILLLLAVSVGVAAVASFIPVYKIASKKPIEAIRNK